MNILTTGLFWGMVLVLIGLSIILRVVFNIDIPVFKIIIGLVLIYLGLQVLLGTPFRASKSKSPCFQEQRFNESKLSNEYNIVFSSGTIDLSEWKDIVNDTRITINVVFATATVLIEPNMPLQIENNTVFGETILPGSSVTFIGKKALTLGDENDSKYTIFLEINTVFGSVELKNKK